MFPDNMLINGETCCYFSTDQQKKRIYLSSAPPCKRNCQKSTPLRWVMRLRDIAAHVDSNGCIETVVIWFYSLRSNTSHNWKHTKTGFVSAASLLSAKHKADGNYFDNTSHEKPTEIEFISAASLLSAKNIADGNHIDNTARIKFGYRICTHAANTYAQEHQNSISSRAPQT